MWQTFPIEFRGGLISSMSPLQQGVNAVGSATTLLNFEPSREGGYKKILGYKKFVTGEVPGSDEILGVKVVNSTSVIAIRKNSQNTSEYYISNLNGWTSLGTAPNLGNRTKGISFNFNGIHKILFVDGVNKPAIFEDSNDTLSFPNLPSDTVGSSHAVIFKQIVFLGAGTKLIFSAPYNETDFSVANGGGVIDIGHQITGLVVFRDQLIIFSRNKIQRLVGSSVADFQLLPIADSIGCLYPDTIQEVGGDIMFMAPDGLRLLGATERLNDFGLEVASFNINKTATEFVNGGTHFSSLVLREKAQYRVFSYIPSRSGRDSDGLLATKFSNQGASEMHWATLRGFKVCCCDGRYTPEREINVFANDDGYVYLMEFGSSFDGDVIEAIYQSPFIPMTDPETRKTLYKLALYVDPTGSFDVNVNFMFDIYRTKNYYDSVRPPTIRLSSESSGVYLYGSAIYGEAIYNTELDKVYNTPVVGSGKTFSMRIEDISTNPSFSLDMAIIEYQQNSRN